MLEREAYRGDRFTIEWYFNESESSPALQYFEQLSVDRQRKVLRLFRFMAEIGELKDITKFRYEGDGVYAFKPQPDRFLCFFFTEKKIIITNAFEKKRDKLPVSEKEKALRYKADYETRVKKRAYYG